MTPPPPGTPVAAQLMKEYLPASEAFLHPLLSSLERYSPCVLTWGMVEPERFPLPEVRSLCVRRFTLRWAIRQAARCAGHDASLGAALRDVGARLLHAHFGDCAVRALRLRGRRIPLVVSFYGHDLSVLPRATSWRRAYRRLFSRGERFLAEGPAMARRIEDLGCPPAKIRIQRLGVRIPDLPPRAPREEIRVLFCARLTEKKGLPYALSAFARCAPGLPRLRLRILGFGDERAWEEVRQSAEREGITERVTLADAVAYDRLWDEMRGADIFLHPSVTAADGDTEGGAPTVLQVAAATGLPVVSSVHADIPEVVLHGRTGLLCRERDVDGLAGAIEALARDEALRRRMGTAGRAHMESDFEAGLCARALERIYAEVA